jgi:hypothetical protein
MELLEPRTRACKRNTPPIIDYQFRAVHQVTVATKQYVEAPITVNRLTVIISTGAPMAAARV